MPEGLVERFAADVRRASRFSPGDDPFPVIEALGYAIVLHLVGALDGIAESERRSLLSVSKAALDAARAFGRGEDDDPDDAEAYAQGARLGELGSRLLEGETSPRLEGLPADALDPTDRRVLRMLRGELDGLSAAACAVRCLMRDDARPRLLWTIAQDALEEARRCAPPAPLRLAAADPAPIRPPDEGRFVGALEDTLLEAVFFPAERQLAVYAATPAFLQVLAPGLTPKDVKPGYFLGELAPGLGPAIELEVRLGDRTFRWGLTLG
jgi:hypothetical protein